MQVGSTVSMHPNVLCLRGFCRTEKERLLVYPLINNSLSYTLRERPNRFARPLNWTTRQANSLGSSEGLAHLHNQGNIRIMHHDICASNILLNVHFEAMIGGFSLAMIMHERNVEEGTIEWPTCSANSGSDSLFYHRYEDVYVNTPICGTFGFIAPEFIYARKCTVKNDVFAYGNMLLELISGQLIYSDDGEIFCLDDWTRKQMNEDQLRRVIDPNLQGNYVEEEAEQLVRLALLCALVRLALLCAHEDPSIRPEMSEVVRMLESQFLQRHPSTRTSCNQK
ncbi:hypothetical protein NL676_001641 [Syzygium grande]|nr:hypothetical protein NL676_001641 [Syzygium grande]